MPDTPAEDSGPSELERLRRALAEARLESDARAAELRALYDATRQLRQWRADFSLQLKNKKSKALWRALSALRGSSVLDDFMPPPLDASEPAATASATHLLPHIFCENRSGECISWNAGGTQLDRRSFQVGADGAQHTLVCEGLITGGKNPLAALRTLIEEAPFGAEVWLIEPDGLTLPKCEPATIQHLLLDESEPNRPHAAHGVDSTLLKEVCDELVRSGIAQPLDTWTQSSARSCYHLALLKRTNPSTPAPNTDATTVAYNSQTPIPGATLLLLHANPFDFGAGGTEQFVLNRTRALKLPRALLTYPNGPREIIVSEIEHGHIESCRTYAFPLRTPLAQYASRHPEAEDVLLWVARQFGVSHALIDHLLNWPLQLPSFLRNAGIPYALMLHDYYVVCPHFNLVNLRNNQLCSTHYGGADCSENCLAMHFAATLHTPGPRDLDAHQSLMYNVMDSADAVICPDRSVAHRVSAALEIALRDDDIHVIPHGMESAPAVVREMHGPRLRIGLLGNLTSPVKGAHWLQEILNASVLLPIDWHVFGRFQGTLPTGAATLTQHGPYEQQAIVGLLQSHEVDLTLFTSLAEETFSLTLSESFCAGIPALVPDLGALGNRVKTTGFGWLVPVLNTVAVIAQIERLCLSPSDRNAVAAKLRGFQHPTPEQNATEYRRVLAGLLSRPSPQPLPRRSHWLERALDRESELHAEYENSRDERWRLEPSGLKSENAEAIVGEDGVCIRAQSGASITFEPTHFSRNQRHVLALDVSSPHRGRLDVYFGTLAEPLGAATQTFRRALTAGRNRIYVELTHPLLIGALRLSFGSRGGVFTLHSAGLRAL